MVVPTIATVALAVVPVVAVVVFAGPIAVVHMPAVGVVIPMRVDVVSAFKGWAVPVSRVPAVAALERLPISLRPGISGSGSGWPSLVAKCRRRLPNADSDRDLSVCGRCRESAGYDAGGGSCKCYQ